MKTASWFTYYGPGRVGVSRASPRNAPGGYRLYKPLAPGEWFQAPYDEYKPLYEAQLAALDPQAVWDDLHRLAAGAEPVILCYEKPPFTLSNFCHRRMAAEWFEKHLGHVVEEAAAQPKPATGRERPAAAPPPKSVGMDFFGTPKTRES